MDRARPRGPRRDPDNRRNGYDRDRPEGRNDRNDYARHNGARDQPQDDRYGRDNRDPYARNVGRYERDGRDSRNYQNGENYRGGPTRGSSDRREQYGIHGRDGVDRGYRQKRDGWGASRNRDRGEFQRERGGYPRERDTRASDREVDLSKTRSLDLVDRSLSRWDVTAKGFENVPAEAAREVGLFQKPGAKKIFVDYQRVWDMVQGKGEFSAGPNGGGGKNSKLDSIQARKSKIVLVSEIDFSEIDPEAVTRFVNNFIVTLDIDDHQGKDSVIESSRLVGAVLIVELSNAPVTTIAMTLNGQSLPDYPDIKLKVSRPSGYISKKGTRGLVEDSKITKNIEDSSEKVALTNVPRTKTKEEVMKFVQEQSGADLTGFKLLKNQLTQENSGVAFLEFRDPSLVQLAISTLCGIQFEKNSLNCFRVCESSLQQAEDTFTTYSSLAGAASSMISPAGPPSTVVQFLNCIDFNDFVLQEVYEGIMKDFNDQCSTCGPVVEVVIPKPTDIKKIPPLHSEPGVGNIYVKFASIEGSSAAMEKYNGYKFGDHTVLVAFFNENDFEFRLW